MAPAAMEHQQQQAPRPEDMKQRVNRCMTKLSDRDTESMAVSELESLARSLTPDSLPMFLSAISDTRPTDKTPLRRHSLRLLSLLSASLPPSHLSPYLPRMLASALRRGLRDADSSVRASLVDAVRSMASALPSALSPVLLPALSHSLLQEQDLPSQSAAALALAAAVDAAAGADPALSRHLQRLLPRLVKLLKSPAFKAKPALVSLLGSAAAAGGAESESLLALLVPTLLDLLGSDDWNARKAAADSLGRVGGSESGELLKGFKKGCVSSLESRRFDKVKIVRESMNQSLELWKRVPDGDESKDGASDGRFPVASVSSNVVSRSPPPIASPIATVTATATATRKNSPTRRLNPPSSGGRDRQTTHSDWRVEIGAPPRQENVARSKDGAENNFRSRMEARRALFDKGGEDNGKASKASGGLKSAARVVPFQEPGSSEELTAGAIGAATDELHGGHKESDLSLIRMHLVQIENQQSSMLSLLQRFIGSSQNGIHCLETRVHGLEMALDVISRDLAVSSGRVANSDPAVKTCCSLPGAEFLSSKFRRRAEGGRYSSRFSFSGASSALADMQDLADKGVQESRRWQQQRFGLQGGFVVNPLAEINPHLADSTEITPNKALKGATHETAMKHARSG